MDTKPPPNLTDVFVYFEGSVFNYVIKGKTSSTRLTWTVTAYDATKGVATIKQKVHAENVTVPLPATFYFKRTAKGGLEYSKSGTSWTPLTSQGSGSTKVNLLFCSKAGKPSSLLGSVKNLVQAASVAYPGGSSAGYKVSSEYDNSKHDAYTYSDTARESYAKAVGFVSSYCHTSDHSDYPPFTYRREVDMVAYRIVLPNGTIREGGQAKPKAPSKLKAVYKKRVSTWNSKSGTYEKRSYMQLTWLDNASNETHFNIYLKATDGKWYPISQFQLQSGAKFSPTTFQSGRFSGQIRAGYYVDWDPGQYHFRLTAASLDDESDPSNEAVASAY